MRNFVQPWDPLVDGLLNMTLATVGEDSLDDDIYTLFASGRLEVWECRSHLAAAEDDRQLISISTRGEPGV